MTTDTSLQTCEQSQNDCCAAEVDNNSTRTKRTFRPRVDIVDGEQAVVMWVEMPGVDENGVSVTVEKNVLTIHGTATETVLEGYRQSQAEYRTGDYEREFTLSDVIDRENIDAVMRNGLLTLTLPKTAAAATHKIAVKRG